MNDDFNKGRREGLKRIAGLTADHRTLEEYEGLLMVFGLSISTITARIKALRKKQERRQEMN